MQDATKAVELDPTDARNFTIRGAVFYQMQRPTRPS